jgi:hypothetical protein
MVLRCPRFGYRFGAQRRQKRAGQCPGFGEVLRGVAFAPRDRDDYDGGRDRDWEI